ncbi:MAG TPA: hypothetical protein PKE38_12100 [Ignavibacteriaceae bacterium]|nr:hypothetical protein [Ignavibacteriaceae bacterium]
MRRILIFLITILLTQSTFGEPMLDDKKKVANSAEEICPITSTSSIYC